jgi:hypothetical protein
VLHRSDLLILPSRATLRDRLVEADRAVVIPESSDLVPALVPSGARAGLRAFLDVPPDALIVGGAGAIGPGSGVDLFVQVAAGVIRRCPELPIHFVWLCDRSAGADATPWSRDIARLGLTPVVHLLDAPPYAEAFAPLFDVYVSIGRDQAPHAIQRGAAVAGRSIAGFEGGGSEAADLGVAYLDVAGVVDVVVRLLQSPQARTDAGERSRALSVESCDVRIAAGRLVAAIEAAATTEPRPARLLAMYQAASALAGSARHRDAEALFDRVARAKASSPELAGKALFKLATLAAGEPSAIGYLRDAVRHFPSHQRAHEMLADLVAGSSGIAEQSNRT